MCDQWYTCRRRWQTSLYIYSDTFQSVYIVTVLWFWTTVWWYLCPVLYRRLKNCYQNSLPDYFCFSLFVILYTIFVLNSSSVFDYKVFVRHDFQPSFIRVNYFADIHNCRWNSRDMYTYEDLIRTDIEPKGDSKKQITYQWFHRWSTVRDIKTFSVGPWCTNWRTLSGRHLLDNDTKEETEEWQSYK